jgi:hypothetical protein
MSPLVSQQENEKSIKRYLNCELSEIFSKEAEHRIKFSGTQYHEQEGNLKLKLMV